MLDAEVVGSGVFLAIEGFCVWRGSSLTVVGKNRMITYL